jgi:hypothetical protein
MKKGLLIIGLVIVVVAGIVYLSQKPSVAQKDYKNIAYKIDGEIFQLKNGLSESEINSSSASKTTTRYFGNEARADLNGDGKEDIVFLLTQNNGGSGTFYYVVAALSSDDGYKGTNGIILGDRIAPQTTEIKDGEIIVNYADRKLDDAFVVEPSIGVSKYLKVVGNQIVENR